MEQAIKVVEFVNIFEDSMNPATNKIYLDIPSNKEEEEEEELRSMDGAGDQKFFLTAAAIAD